MTAAQNTAPPGPARTVYFDHAATSWPKAPGVAEEMQRALVELGGNPGRGAYRMAVDTARAIHGVRRDAAALLGVHDSKNLLFQPGCTQALNLALFGLLSPGDRVVACPAEHNAVARPLNVLSQRGVEVVLAETDDAGQVDPDSVQELVARVPTRAVVCQHAGNVTGAIQPVADLADIAHEHGAIMIVDGAQAGGHLSVDLGTLVGRRLGVLGPQGTARPSRSRAPLSCARVRDRPARVRRHGAGRERASRRTDQPARPLRSRDSQRSRHRRTGGCRSMACRERRSATGSRDGARAAAARRNRHAGRVPSC